MKTDSGPVKLGLVGTGFILNDFYMPALREIPEARVVAVAGRTQGKTDAFARRWGIAKAYHGEASYERLCGDPDVDAVVVALPNDLHLPVIVAAAERGKAVVCEKPLCRNLAEADEALRVVRKQRVVHCYAENQIFIPQVVRARRFIEDGAIGDVTWVRSREAHSGPHSKWFWDPERAGGGVLLDMGCHSIEVTRYLFGRRPEATSAWVATLGHKTTLEDNSVVLLRYEGGGLGQCENSWTAKGGLDVRLEVFGSEGSVFVDTTRETGIRVFTTGSGGKAGYIVEKADAQSGWVYPAWSEHINNGYLSELKHFVDSIARGRQPSETFEDGRLVNAIMEAAYRSAREGRWLDLEGAPDRRTGAAGRR
ncbi:MAG: Gfo/Idh/MocA family oxidoreductase [Nitrososphaerales archaeon]